MMENLENEILKIKRDDIREFVKEVFSNTDANFWISPSSSTGKYHPPEDNGEGGLVRHVKKGVVVVEQYARRALFNELELDMAIAGILLHDTCKNGVPWGKDTNYTHGLITYEWLQQFKLNDKLAKEIVINAVRYHMAPWCYSVNPFQNRAYTKDEMLKNIEELQRALVYPSRIEIAVREGDYWASRKTMSFMPGQTVWLELQNRHDQPSELS